jgi:hypothetical protein
MSKVHNNHSPVLVHNQDRSQVLAEEGIKRSLSEINLRQEHDLPVIPFRTKPSANNQPIFDLGTSSTTRLETSKYGEQGSTIPVFDGDGGLDFTLILGLERTLFAALNNAWLLAIGGIGLMSVGSDDNRATNAGIIILCGGITSSLIAYGMHFLRVWQVSIW